MITPQLALQAKMGLKNYFRNRKPELQEKTVHDADHEMSEPHLAQPPLFRQSGWSTPNGANGYRSSRASVAASTRFSWAQDIKHEVMANYIFQQQCSSLWIGDVSGRSEDVLLRKSRGNYLACPPQLEQSVFGLACAQLNLYVRVWDTTTHDFC